MSAAWLTAFDRFCFGPEKAPATAAIYLLRLHMLHLGLEHRKGGLT